MWADTECIRPNGRPAGHVNKVTVNAAAGLACVAGGWDHLAEAANATATLAATFDEAVNAMPRRLRVEAARIVALPRTDPRDYGHQVAILAGFSARLGCVVAYEFRGDAYFGPALTSLMALPWVAGPIVLNRPADVVEVARAQAAELRRDYPAIGCGRLTIAVVERERVVCHAPYDLTADAWITPAGPACSDASPRCAPAPADGSPQGPPRVSILCRGGLTLQAAAPVPAGTE